MWTDLKAAAQAGIVQGVKIAVATLIVLVAVSWFLGDYFLVRQQARNGQVAFERLQQAIQQQQQQRAAAVAPQPPKEK